MRTPLGLINILAGHLPYFSGPAIRPKYSDCADCGKPTKLELCFRCQEKRKPLDSGKTDGKIPV